MRVSVLVTFPQADGLRASAIEAFAAGAGGLVLEGAPDKGGLILDERFPALPIPGATLAAIDLAAANPASAPLFVTRGTIDVDRIGEAEGREDGVGIFADPEIGAFTVCAGSPPLGTTVDVARHLDVAALRAKGLDGKGVAVAVMDSGINIAHLRNRGLKAKFRSSLSWSPLRGGAAPGHHAIGHGTMCAYDALIAAPNATLLDFPILTSTRQGGNVMDGLLSNAILAYSYLLTRLSAPSWKFKGLVVNNSWGLYHSSWDFPAGHPGRYANNPNHPFNLIVGTLSRAGADLLFSAGNCGSPCPDRRCQGVTANTIVGANAHPDVMTIAGCDIHDVRAGYSSQGPGIAGMVHDKPDVTAYTHFLGSEAFGTGSPDSGTSAASAVAAGCVAAMRTRLNSFAEPPPGLMSAFKAKANGVPVPGWNADYGCGIIRPLAVAAHYGL
ncbi:S8 family serine peptidase [Methylobacterium sp. E-045]|uniref:S8 family serine peptidase n=1 Tax=Methylobacterium sp. E-045 TaxID=2836575 RepID=UPI001FB86622|nr:S8 family serine peptidase [Methylobacterium sp. E-045]MCJ2129289.1 S8 family serine peptidase [Methylobacterium sp. E-045]